MGEILVKKLVNGVFCVINESMTLVGWSVGVSNAAENTKRFADLIFIVVQERLLSGCRCDCVQRFPSVNGRRGG